MSTNESMKARTTTLGTRSGGSLDSALMRLRERDRRALALRFFEGRTAREIGLLQGISEEAARQRVWRALERLRAILGCGA